MEKHVCPVWMGYVLANPLRRLLQNPDKILAPYIREGMSCLDIGCAMGFFSLPMARTVGSSGIVYCVDFQEKMLTALERKAKRKNLLERMAMLCCTQESLCLDDFQEKVDFALAMAVVHEVPNEQVFFAEVWSALKAKGCLLLAEPSRHINESDFASEVEWAQKTGFDVVVYPRVPKSHAALLRKPCDA